MSKGYRTGTPEEQNIEDAFYVIEANNFEYSVLWERNRYVENGVEKTYAKWDEILSGTGETIGYLENRPVFISIRFAKINGRIVVFVFPTSTVVDYNMLEAWLLKKCNPLLPDGSRAFSSANEFFRCVRATEAANAA